MTTSMLRRDTIDSGALAVVGNLGGKFLSVPVGVYTASVLGPQGYSVLTAVTVFTQYLGYLNLGMLSNLTPQTMR
jgi:O-antigen/teichoic acid export membrane protein